MRGLCGMRVLGNMLAAVSVEVSVEVLVEASVDEMVDVWGVGSGRSAAATYRGMRRHAPGQ